MLPGADRRYCPTGFPDTDDLENGTWRNEPQSGGLDTIRNISVAAHERLSKKMRDDLKLYFNGEGATNFQNQRIGI